MLPPPPSRSIPTRNAAILAVRKIKYWESKESKEDSIMKKSVLEHRIQKNMLKNNCLNNPRKRKKLKNTDDIKKPVQIENSSNSNVTILDSREVTSHVDNSIPSHQEKNSDQEIDTSLSVMKRREKEAKAIARNQHSNQRMFLSRRLSRNIENSRHHSSPNFSPITATTLLFSPEMNPSVVKTKTYSH
jgi:hypothetical protein